MLFFLIAWNVVLPIFLLMALGFLVQRRLGFDIPSLTRLNFWIFVPAFLFIHFTESRLTGAQMLSIATHFVIFFPLLALSTWTLCTILRTRDSMRRALTSSVIFYNSGNYGVPVAQLAFGAAGASVQAIVIVFQNLTNFSIGLGLHAGAQGMSRKEQWKEVFKLPFIYTFAAAAFFRVTQIPLPVPLGKSLHFIADGLVPIALVTLGAQMATLKSYKFTKALGLTLFLRLLCAPVLSLGVVKLLGIPITGHAGEVGRLLILSTSFPTAVNSALLAIEYNNEPDYAASAVFYTTMASAVTVSFVIYLLNKMMAT